MWGENFEALSQRTWNGQFHVPYVMTLECQKVFRKLMTIGPSQRTTLEDTMKDPRVNTGQAGDLKPYSELPWSDTDSQVTEIMKNLGFKLHKM